MVRILLCSVGLVLCVPSPSSACTWSSDVLGQPFARASDLFVGTVVESPYVRGKDGRDTADITKLLKDGPRSWQDVRFEARLLVRARYRGSLTVGTEVTIGLEAPCGMMSFAEGETYIVSARRQKGTLSLLPYFAHVRIDPIDVSERRQVEFALEMAGGRGAKRILEQLGRQDGSGAAR